MQVQPLTDPETLKSLLARAGIQPTRSAGQNFLICQEVVEATLAALEGGPKQVTELGAGIGTLTAALASSSFHVRAIERDQALAGVLKRMLPPAKRENVDVLEADLRSASWEWATPYQLVGNIPYNLSGLILRRITQLSHVPTQAVLLLQKEVAQRLTAHPGEAHLLSVAIQLWGEIHPLIRVPASCFWPQPQVDSALVLLIPRPDARNTPQEREAILKIAKVFFQARRKQIGTTLRDALHVTAKDVQSVTAAVGLTRTQRPQELTVEQWKKLARLLRSLTSQKDKINLG